MSIVTENEKMGGVLIEDTPHTAWAICDKETGHLCALAADRRTAEHIVQKKLGPSGGRSDAYIVEVWHVMQSPEDFDEVIWEEE